MPTSSGRFSEPASMLNGAWVMMASSPCARTGSSKIGWEWSDSADVGIHLKRR